MKKIGCLMGITNKSHKTNDDLLECCSLKTIYNLILYRVNVGKRMIVNLKANKSEIIMSLTANKVSITYHHQGRSMVFSTHFFFVCILLSTFFT